MKQHDSLSEILVLASVGQDAALIAGTLAASGIEARRVHALDEVCEQLRAGEGIGMTGLIVTEESLESAQHVDVLAACLHHQPAWSDFPICVLTVPGDRPSTLARWRLFEALGNVTLLARPLTVEALLSVGRGMARSRARQRQTKHHLDELRDAAQLLERRVMERTEELMAIEETLRQSQKMEAIGQLTGGIAHDFNNLLQVINTNMELMKLRIRQERFGDVERHVLSAHDATQRAGALTHRLLAFSRRQTLDPKPVRPNQLISDMLDLIGRTLGPLIDVRTELSAQPHWTLCDPPQLENALLNLCINARDAMPTGGTLAIVTDKITLDGRDARLHDLPDGDYVIIEVTDTGIGMSADVISRAFDPFFTTKPLGQGTGLGLSMIYGFAQQSGGRVSIESTVEAGTTVRLHLPLLDDAPATRENERNAPLIAQPETRSTVLVVDDEATIRTLAAEVLTGAGYHVIEARDGLSGLSVLESNVNIDLLVTDVGMPGMNGKEMADRARHMRPQLDVLYITGYAEKAIFGDGNIDTGAHLLTKPFAIDDLLACVGKIIAQHGC
jgi:signal transduction histidine kinase/CheY-like chemotaxis protein